MIQAFAFYLFSGVMILSALLTITARNPVHSVLWLILAFFNAAGLMLLLGAEFIAMLLVIVYVGAVAVLFLFVVMMLDIDFAELRGGFTRYLGFGSVVAVVLLAEIIIAVTVRGSGAIGFGTGAGPTPAGMSNIQALGQLLYTRYLYIFEAAGLVLLVAMIGAIVLTHRDRKDYRAQRPSDQIRRRPQDATRNVNQPVGVGVEL
jgi:NADH-quinone oxidoreductase subunit J